MAEKGHVVSRQVLEGEGHVHEFVFDKPSMNSWIISNLALRPCARFSQVMCFEVVVSKSDAAPALSQRPL